MTAVKEETQLLIIEKEPPITWLRLNRPSVLNSLNSAILRSLLKACEELSKDKETRIVVVIGSGDKSFSAGADLTERKDMTEEQVIKYHQLIQKTMNAVEALPQPVIAAINGSAYGGGVELALACDLRMMVDDAIMRLTEVRLGIIPGAGGTQRLPRLIGKSKAKEMIFAAKPLSAKEAFDIGLVNKLVSKTNLQEEARKWANEIAQAAPLSLRSAKEAIDGGFALDLKAGLEIETKAYMKLLKTKDRLEGLKAFAEKRSPVYKGE
jgi:enoyl-CoA hydratase/carnithine racemase